jgi:hypothetical protein
MIQATPNHPSWASVIAPTFYTLFGAGLGFSFGRLKDWLEARIAKKSFLRAIRVELSAIREQLKGTLNSATENKKSLESGKREVMHLATTYPTGVFVSQLGKLRNVCDPLTMEAIRFYDLLSNLERIKSHLTSFSFEFVRLSGGPEDLGSGETVASLYALALDEVIKRLSELIPIADSLITQLPV